MVEGQPQKGSSASQKDLTAAIQGMSLFLNIVVPIKESPRDSANFCGPVS